MAAGGKTPGHKADDGIGAEQEKTGGKQGIIGRAAGFVGGGHGHVRRQGAHAGGRALRELRRIAGEMERLRHGGLTPWRVAAAKKQYRGQLLVAEDNNESLALALGKSYMRYGSVLSQEEQAQRIEAVTVEQMQAVADDIMDTRQWSLLVLE